MNKYYIYGVNNMGCKHYLGNKKDNSCSLWAGADKDLRAVYDDMQQAIQKVEQLNYYCRFGSTRHNIERVGE